MNILVLPAGIVHAFPLPNIPNVFNVRDYGAKGDGTTDDTAAIQAAVNAARVVKAPLVYLPNGTYRVSDTIQLCATGADNEWMTFQGESMTGTVIRLADKASGFGDRNNPKAVVLATPQPGGATFQHQSVIDLTINTGSNNPGVIALDQHANNVGVSENLLLKSADGNGYLGFAFNRNYGGTHFVKNVEVVGFSTGFDLSIRSAKSNILLEHIIVRNAHIGIYCQKRCIGIRDLQTFNVDKPVDNEDETNLAIIDSAFSYDRAGGSCGIDFRHTSGHLFVRNVSAKGFKSVVADNGTPAGGTYIDEWHTGDGVKLSDRAPDRTLNLPIKETPDLAWDLSKSVIVDCEKQVYDSDAIQNAIDKSGKEIVILSGVDRSRNNTGIVKLDKSIYVRGGVRRIYGSKMEVSFDADDDPRYAFIIETGGWPMVSIDTFKNVNGGIRNQSSKTVVLRELRLRHPFRTCYETAAEKPGDLFLESFNPVGNNKALEPGPQLIFRNQKVWSRGLNMTGVSDQLHAYNSDVWLFGINSGEIHPETWLAAHMGSHLEIFSCFMDTGGGDHSGDRPSGGMIKSYGGNISVASCGVFKKRDVPLSTLLWEQHDGEGNGGKTRTKPLLELPVSPSYYHMPFYSCSLLPADKDAIKAVLEKAEAPREAITNQVPEKVTVKSGKKTKSRTK
ncbi:MAG: hypothetical protein HZC28_03025 [Spirochaetes bacterium]|nr:hypothetical protein [Spirochaetota bacterium]